MKRIAINGFGRIGRAALKIIMDTAGLEVVAINDLLPLESAKYLLKYDSVYGPYERQVQATANDLIVDDTKIHYSSLSDPKQLPWKELNVEVVIESTGMFTELGQAEKHIEAGAKTVVLSGPTKNVEIPTPVFLAGTPSSY